MIYKTTISECGNFKTEMCIGIRFSRHITYKKDRDESGDIIWLQVDYDYKSRLDCNTTLEEVQLTI